MIICRENRGARINLSMGVIFNDSKHDIILREYEILTLKRNNTKRVCFQFPDE